MLVAGVAARRMFGASRARAGAAAPSSGNAWHALAQPVGNLAVTFRRSPAEDAGRAPVGVRPNASH